ncbi:hypothetical protein SCUCBS95973_003793 [Sporothrix curviconia]|uniref:Dead deah box DNA helicase n=1 Tax=Sporothrix curviconia TaxID=1260050 RepID=A0ABP0BIB2_9PEZI
MESDLAPHFIFSSVEAVFAEVTRLKRQRGDDTLVFGHVTPADFRDVEAERDRIDEHSRLFYQPAEECLIITVPTSPHEQMHLGLYQDIVLAMGQMGVGREWAGTGATTMDPPNGSSGQADSAGFPRSSRTSSGWPTLVIEAGFSQTLPSLRVKMRWWFSSSGHQVKVVIIVKIELANERVRMEKWVEEIGRPGATSTRAATRLGLVALQPVCQQAIEIDWTGPQRLQHTPTQARTAHQFRVTGGPLVIRFSEIFLRQPTGQEGDITITDSQLQDLAARFWQSV